MNSKPSLELIYSYEPTGKCPVQAEGTLNGLPFYFRSRGSHWTLYVAPSKRGDYFDKKAWRHSEPYDGVNAKIDVEINDGRIFAAGLAEEDECKKFIDKAAKIYTMEHTNKL